MKVIILCGGKGSRLKEETEFRPKPMVRIGGKPLIWHIMKIYRAAGFRDFILTLGYKGEMFKDYFLAHQQANNDFTLDLSTRRLTYHTSVDDDFRITFAETGLESLTGERLAQVKKYVRGDEFMVTYGDVVGDVDMKKLLQFHRRHKKLATVTVVRPFLRYGLVDLDPSSGMVKRFREKPMMEGYVNGGFMVFHKKAWPFLTEGMLEDGLVRLAQAGELAAYSHPGFWRAIDTYRELQEMIDVWGAEKPWAIW